MFRFQKSQILIFGLYFLFCSPTWSVESSEQRRLALVIGNSRYNMNPLRNPVKDAEAMSEILGRAGFCVTSVYDADLETMENAFNEFVKALGQGDVTLVYFSGHGVQIEGQLYLLPTDIDQNDPTAIKHKTHSAALISARLANAGTSLDTVIVDTCRSDLPTGFLPSGPTSLPNPKTETSRTGSCIIYSTHAFAPALDSSGSQLSLFTRHLVSNMEIPELTLYELFVRTSQSVESESGSAQKPVIFLSGRAGEFVLLSTP